MKKLITLLLGLTAVVVQSNAQSVSLSITTPPCASNGVVQATATGISGTVTYTFRNYYSSTPLATNTTGILTGYNGEAFYAEASNGTQFAYAHSVGAPPFTYSTTTTPGVCPANGSASVSVTGGTSPYTIQWSVTGTTTVVATGSSVSLPPNKYDITITDAAGCQSGSFVTHDSLSVGQTVPFTYSKNVTPAACTNGSASITGITGGTAPYSYLWSNSATTSAVSGLLRGYYTVSITDAAGCSKTDFVNVIQTPNITVNVTPTSATCTSPNGAAMAFGSGGVGPYTYLWSNAQTTPSITGIAGGTSLNVTATDANGCTGTGYTYVNTTSPIYATFTTTNSSCTAPTGSATLSLSGGLAPYSVTWNTFPVQTGVTASALAPGAYSFTVTDANGCKRSGTVGISPATTLYAYANSTAATCNSNNGTVAAIVSGGVTPYTYLWNTSATGSSLSGVPGGSYTVTVTDAAGCKSTAYTTVNRTSPVNLSNAVSQASCEFTADGSITITPTGGTAPYTYSWAGTTATTGSATGLKTGNYGVYVSDANGCTASAYLPVGYNAANTSCYCTITGTVYNDANLNCVRDAGEAGIPNIQIRCSGHGYTYTNSAGVYSFRVPTGTYTLSQSVQSYYPLAPCQSNAVSITTTASTGCVNTVNFADTVTSIHDLSVYTVSVAGPPIPGFNYYQRLIVRNDGTLNETPTVGYRYDPQLGSPVSTSIFYSGAGLNHYRNNSSFPVLAPGGVQQSSFQYLVPTNIPINTPLAYYDSAVSALPMSSWLNDYTPWTNVSTYNSAVMGAFDPNSKEVTPAGKGAQGYITNKDSVLTYTIHFQNEGNWPASKVVLVDTLDADFIVSSLKPIAGSHPFKATITDGTPAVVSFTFDPIYLPAKQTDLVGSMGYVLYSIRQKPGLPVGTKLENSASIYFDYNAPIKTNTALNTIGEETQEPNSVPYVNAGSIDMSVFPNPASNSVRVKIQITDGTGTVRIRLVNLLGQSMLQQQASVRQGENIFEANTSNLAAGLYFVEVSDGTRTATRKLNIVR